MIDDLISLPSPLVNLRGRQPKVSTELLCTLPLSCINRVVGYETPDDDLWYSFGAKMEVPTGKEAWTKVKLVESNPAGICEFFCLSDRPVDCNNPKVTKDARLYCLGVSVTDRRTSRISHRYVLWRNVFEIMHYITEDSIVDTPVEGVVAREVRLLGELCGRPDIIDVVKNYPEDYKDVLISEIPCSKDDPVDAVCQLGANIRTYSELTGYDPWRLDVDPIDVFRGVNIPASWTDLTPVQTSHLLQLLQFGSITLGEILFLLSPSFHLHAHTRPTSITTLSPDTRFCVRADKETGVFSVIKYIERLPYNEFDLEIARNSGGKCIVSKFQVFGRFGEKKFTGDDLTDHKIVTDPILNTLLSTVEHAFPNLLKARVQRSWKEEIYITVLNVNGKTETYYFDLFAGTLCSQSLIRDYNGAMFCLS